MVTTNGTKTAVSSLSRGECIFWSTWLTRNDAVFDRKNVTLLFIGYFQGDLLDTSLVHSSQGGRLIQFEVGMSTIGDYNNRDFP